MRILVSTFAFPPSLGGMETAAVTLATGLTQRGYDVTVAATTPSNEPDNYPFKVVRAPDAMTMFKLTQDTDLLWQNHISLRMIWPALLLRKPIVIVHHLVLSTDVGSGPEYGDIKSIACSFGNNAYVSEFLRIQAGLPGPVIYNSYDEATFRLMPQIERTRDVVFLGRLQPYKGADILIDAMAMLAQRGQQINATIIGGGPEENALREQAARLRIADRVEFAGVLRGEALAKKLNAHRLIAIPPRADEAFSITALEGMACGCVPIGTQSGGLPEAIGPCGPVIAQNDPAAMADSLSHLLADEAVYTHYRNALPSHLARFTENALMTSVESLIADATAPVATNGRQHLSLSSLR